MININEIDLVYERYGYTVKNIGGVRIYEYKQGRYFGVDLFNYTDSDNIEKLQKEYSRQGFATLIRNYKNVIEVEDELFKGFFQVDNFRLALNRKYETFVNKQLIGLPDTAKYEYINGQYNYSFFDTDGIPTTMQDYESKSVLEHITDLIKNTKGALFLIIEAAAGYGKTCTAYEIIKNISEIDTDIVPFYIELSRNREARIFKHILQNEIEEQFQNFVKSDVVLHQIKEGKIPVIIDGFDELLSKDLSQNESQLRDVESMLATIVNLLENKAKIIITSRKTAIFSGEEFYNWINNSVNKYNVARFALSEPKIENWLSDEQINILDESEFPIENVANPVLLSYIRNISTSELKELSKDSKNIVDKYFEFLLSRERTRQELHFDNETQLRIYKKLVRLMSEFDIKSENKSFIKELIKDYNRTIFEDYIKNYPKYPKPTHDELADTLSNHALLDRKQHDNIGFINEFIFGILIGRNLIEGKYQEHYKTDFTSKVSQNFASLALLAFKVQPKDRRLKLWEIFYNNPFNYDNQFCFYRDIYLKNELVCNFSDTIIEEFVCSDIEFVKEAQFKNFIFSNCQFNNCKFNKYSFVDSGFVNCKFFDCVWTENSLYTNGSAMYVTGCESNDNFIDSFYICLEDSTNLEINIEERILKYFIKSDVKINTMKRLSKIREDLKGFNHKEIERTIDNLKKKSYIFINGDMCIIQREGISYFNSKYHY